MARPRKVKQATEAELKKRAVVFDSLPVIVKCTGDGCEKKETCHRFSSTPAEKNQPWFCEQVSMPDKNKCKFFMEIPE